MRIYLPFAALVASLAFAGCADDRDHSTPVDDDDGLAPTTQYLTPVQHLTRASLALRGIRPTLSELELVAADPNKLGDLVDGYINSPEFGVTMRDLHNETLLLRLEQPTFTFTSLAPIPGKTFLEMSHSVFEEPLRLIENVIMTNQPYTRIVTTNYTMADGIVAGVWGLPHTGAGDQWEKTMWTDGRPAAGILSTSSLFHRWRSTGFNYNRGRANMVSRALLCHGFLSADIMVDTNIDLSNPDVVADAVVQNKSCAGCHQTLDPLASYMFPHRGQLNAGAVTAFPVAYWLPGQVDAWMRTNKRPPMFFGETANGLAGLGRAIAKDPRFAKCAATHFASYFTEVAEDQLPAAWIAKLQDQFVASNYSAKQLAKAVVMSDQFRVAGDTDAARADNVVGYLKTRPEQLSRTLQALTGFSWQTTPGGQARGMPIGLATLLESDFVGFRVLFGGIDSYFVTSPVFTMNATSSLVARSAASAAADTVVEYDAAQPIANRRLFVKADITSTDDTSVRAQLAYLHARVYGELVKPDDVAVDDALDMFHDALAASGDAKRAWKITLTGMFGDFRALFY